jgi:putative endonuclease
VNDPVEKRKAALVRMKRIWYYVYMLLLSNGSYYTGYTVDVRKRLSEHVTGRGSKCVRSFPPEKILCVWKCSLKNEAMSVECLIKKMKRIEKEAIVANPPDLCRIMEKKGFALKEVKRYRSMSV